MSEKLLSKSEAGNNFLFYKVRLQAEHAGLEALDVKIITIMSNTMLRKAAGI